MSGRPAAARQTRPEVLAAIAATLRGHGWQWKVITEILDRSRTQLWRYGAKMKQQKPKMKHHRD